MWNYVLMVSLALTALGCSTEVTVLGDGSPPGDQPPTTSTSSSTGTGPSTPANEFAALEVVLTWEGDAEVDLYVYEPNGDVLSWSNPDTENGGHYTTYDTGAKAAWPQAPLVGGYEIFLSVFYVLGKVPYVVSVAQDGELVGRWEGQVYEHQEDDGILVTTVDVN